MKIIEHYICGKENNELTCEDGIVISKNLVAIIDGATAKGEMLWSGCKSGLYTKNLLRQYLQGQDICMLNAESLFANLNNVLKEKMSVVNGIKTEDFLRASIIIYNDVFKEVWSYGDCQCMINGELFSHSKKIDALNSDMRSKVIIDALNNGMTLADIMINDVGRSAIMASLLKQFDYENSDDEFGYPVLNGQGINFRLLKKYSVKTGDTVILASDGYPILCDNLADSEEKLRDILLNDPMCFKLYKSTKGVQQGNVSFDDRAYCRIVV